MKIKHFTGYGSVEVTKKLKIKFKDSYGYKKNKLILEVKGNHEWGLVRDDIYDVRNWIFNKFEKKFNGHDYEIQMFVTNSYVNDTEIAIYTFIY